MKKHLLILSLVFAFSIGKSQNLANTEWLGTNPPSPNLWFHFSTDTLYYSLSPTGFTPISVYTASNGQFAIFDLPGASLCTDTGFYNYSIVAPNLFFTLINDNCVSRKNTLLDYNWIQIPTGVDEMSASSEIVISQNPGEDFFNIVLPGKMKGDKEISLFDINGRIVFHENSEENTIRIDIGFLSNGMYIGRLYNSSINKSFVIVR